MFSDLAENSSAGLLSSGSKASQPLIGQFQIHFGNLRSGKAHYESCFVKFKTRITYPSVKYPKPCICMGVSAGVNVRNGNSFRKIGEAEVWAIP